MTDKAAARLSVDSHAPFGFHGVRAPFTDCGLQTRPHVVSSAFICSEGIWMETSGETEQPVTSVSPRISPPPCTRSVCRHLLPAICLGFRRLSLRSVGSLSKWSVAAFRLARATVADDCHRRLSLCYLGSLSKRSVTAFRLALAEHYKSGSFTPISLSLSLSLCCLKV